MMRTADICFVLLFALSLGAPAFAQKPDSAGQGQAQGQAKSQGKGTDKGNKGKSDQGRDAKGQGAGNAAGKPGDPPRYTIVERDQRAIYDYYGREFAAGHCPPGLAKKNNGCLPPGQAKKLWAAGQPLPREVVYYGLPQALVIRLTPPPAGYRYVRVADDVLLMQTGTRLIVDAVLNLNRF